ncbi:glutathionylspermidine synthase family protein [Sphingomonas sp.]|uniref:glutathionylspermidine synthase family protein n=1 Tax=Sphingomonas sp. TaxID=28214 RepID=UPI003B3B8E1C
MIRDTVAPRPDWQSRVEARGLIWHSTDGKPYWDEGTFYRFDRIEVDLIEGATAELYRLFLEAGQAVIDDPKALAVFGIPPDWHDAIRDAWRDEPPALNFGRFDLGYRGDGPPKLFEFNCDTPTSLLEASVIQWDWKQDVLPNTDQFNSLHQRLVGKWADLRSLVPDRQVHFAHVADAVGEDTVTVAYLRDTAEEAGLKTKAIAIDDIGWDRQQGLFVDLDEQVMTTIFKLYPWEWLTDEQFGRNLLESLDRTIWMEPVWKMIWSNKAILPVLWSMFPDHPNLLPASYSPLGGDVVTKPALSREGANVVIHRDATVIAASSGAYQDSHTIYQALYDLPQTAPGCYPVIGSWIVDGAPAGMGIREDGLITGNMARFVPHVIG